LGFLTLDELLFQPRYRTALKKWQPSPGGDNSLQAGIFGHLLEQAEKRKREVGEGCLGIFYDADRWRGGRGSCQLGEGIIIN
jgi:hypothetical protein